MNLNNNRKVAGVIRIFGILETTEMNEEGSETKNVNNITESSNKDPGDEDS